MPQIGFAVGYIFDIHILFKNILFLFYNYSRSFTCYYFNFIYMQLNTAFYFNSFHVREKAQLFRCFKVRSTVKVFVACSACWTFINCVRQIIS